MTVPYRSVLLVASLSLSTVAWAQDAQPTVNGNGYDADIDLIKPMFTPEILPGIDVPDNRRAGTVRWGLSTQYAWNSLVLYEFDEEIGSVVQHRANATLGTSVDITRAFTARLSLPLLFQYGSEVPRYRSDGFAVGDLNVGAHLAFFRRPAVGLGVRVDMALPTSRRDFYAGERMPRVNPAFLAMFDIGRVRIATDLGANIRFRDVTTTEDFTLGTELTWNNGVRVDILPDQLRAGASIYSRFGFTNFFGAAESSGEALLTVAYKALPILWVNVGAGRGFTQGYGSSDVRAYISLDFMRVAPPKEDPDAFTEGDGSADAGKDGLQFNVRDIGQIRAEGEGEEEEEEWEEGELAKVESERIKIRYAIRFAVGTDRILDESLPTLDQIAELMNDDARIAHLVIEGHSSSDGDFEPNFELSKSRAASIWRRLVDQGVHPSRLSYRGMGEIMPAEATGGFDELQASRRVVFQIVKQYESWETPPDYDLDLKYPWNGEDYQAVQPTMPGPESLDDVLGEGGDDAPRERPTRDDEDAFDDVDFGGSDEDDEAMEFEDDGADESSEEGSPWGPDDSGTDEDSPTEGTQTDEESP